MYYLVSAFTSSSSIPTFIPMTLVTGMLFLPLAMLWMPPVHIILFFPAVADRCLIMLTSEVAIFLPVNFILQVWPVYTIDHYLMTMVHIKAGITCRQYSGPVPAVTVSIDIYPVRYII